jgi:cysteine desulfurase/selenocysteine lyase
VDAAENRIASLDVYRDAFPVVKRRVWLNHASQGTLSDRVVDALASFTQQHARGELSDESGEQLCARVREAAAQFINCRSEEIAFTKNVPDALNIIAHGLAWEPGDRIVIPDQEFPANVYPWRSLAAHGVETVTVPSLDSGVPIGALIDAIDARTRVVALSWVEFSTGYRSDLRSIANACHERGALLCVDAIQGLGALRFDARAFDVDIAVTSSHKWLLGPTGVGWMYCKQEVIDRLAVCFAGQCSVDRRGSRSFLEYDLPLWPDARKFEPGVHNQPGLVGLEASLELFREVGMRRVEERVKGLGDLVARGLTDRGFHVVTSRDGEDWSGIVSFESDRHTPQVIHASLLSHDVIVSLREPVVRVSTHFYNNEEDVDRFFAALPR